MTEANLPTDFVQFLILQIPNFAGLIILAIIQWRINSRLLDMLESELKDCQANREREPSEPAK